MMTFFAFCLTYFVISLGNQALWRQCQHIPSSVLMWASEGTLGALVRRSRLSAINIRRLHYHNDFFVDCWSCLAGLLLRSNTGCIRQAPLVQSRVSLPEPHCLSSERCIDIACHLPLVVAACYRNSRYLCRSSDSFIASAPTTCLYLRR